MEVRAAQESQRARRSLAATWSTVGVSYADGKILASILLSYHRTRPATIGPKLLDGWLDHLVGWAEIDHYAPLEELAPFRESLRAGGVKAEVELYPGVEHGFAFPQRPAYNKDAAERHWERLFALFERALTG